MRWSRRVPDFVDEVGRAAVASSDAHRAELIGTARTRFPGRTSADLRAAIADRTTTWEGESYAWSHQLGMFRQQTAKNLRAIRDELRGKVRRDGTGRRVPPGEVRCRSGRPPR